MNIEIVQIADRGVPNQERLHLRVMKPANLIFYVVLVSMQYDEKVVRMPSHTFWFPVQLVNAGDHVILYSGPGQDTSRYADDGHQNFFYYWGLDRTVWHDPASCAVFMELAEWRTTPVEGGLPAADTQNSLGGMLGRMGSFLPKPPQ